MKAFLNVGGGNKQIAIPAHYAAWRHDLLDIDPAAKPDVLLDARQLATLPAATYDAVFCSHNLEHYHRHEAVRVVRGFHHVLRAAGFAEIYVPDLAAVIQHVAKNNLDIDDQLYVSPAGPILVRDVFYGYHPRIESSGQDFYSHKTGFTPKALVRMMTENGFPLYALTMRGDFEIGGYFFKQPPAPDIIQLLHLKSPSPAPAPSSQKQ